MACLSQYLSDKIISLIFAVIQAALIALVTKVWIDKAFREQKVLGKNLQQYGIKKVSRDKGGTLSASAREIVFGLNKREVPSELDLCFITGNGFFRDFQTKKDYLGKLLEEGCRIKVLLANPDRGHFADYKVEDFADESRLDEITDYYLAILEGRERAQSFLEREYTMLIKKKLPQERGAKRDALRERLRILYDAEGRRVGTGDHNYQVKNIRSICDELRKRAAKNGSIELRHYEDEYQMPIILVRTRAGKDNKEDSIFLWTNINAPIKETSESINVFCSSEVDEVNDKAFLSDVCTSFDYLWETYDTKEEKQA